MKELQQSHSEQTDSEEESNDETEEEVVIPFCKEEEQVRLLPLRNRVQKTMRNLSTNAYSFDFKNLWECFLPRIVRAHTHNL